VPDVPEFLFRAQEIATGLSIVGTLIHLPAPPPVPSGRPRRQSVTDIRRQKARRKRRRRIATSAVAGACALALLLFVGALAMAAKSSNDEIPEGVTVGGVDVGGLKRDAAVAKLEKAIGTPSRRPVKVKAAGKTRRLSADEAGVKVDLAGAVDHALAEGREGNFIGRGWREITGGSVDSDEEAAVSVDRKAVAKFVDGLAKDVNRPAVDAELSLAVTDVAVSPAKKGRKLASADTVEKRVVRAFRSPGGKRKIKAKVAVVKPKVTERDVWAKNPVVVTVAHDAQTVRVFKDGDVVKTYRVAVGQDKFPTPKGRFAVDRKEKNPVWNVPDSDWAGSLAGTTVPGGSPQNPLVARWVGISGSVGFHGTRDLGSLGSRASHGCVRMNPSDVIDLYDRVEVGTPILIA
jgi:lipoprotein-anchoring transpeptidase ErfK/SrfK